MTQETQQVEVKANAAGYPTIYVDGVDISKNCTSAVIKLDGGSRYATVELTMAPVVVDVDVAAVLRIVKNDTAVPPYYGAFSFWDNPEDAVYDDL